MLQPVRLALADFDNSFELALRRPGVDTSSVPEHASLQLLKDPLRERALVGRDRWIKAAQHPCSVIQQMQIGLEREEDLQMHLDLDDERRSHAHVQPAIEEHVAVTSRGLGVITTLARDSVLDAAHSEARGGRGAQPCKDLLESGEAVANNASSAIIQQTGVVAVVFFLNFLERAWNALRSLGRRQNFTPRPSGDSAAGQPLHAWGGIHCPREEQ
mmetsp:Transcript_98396/g.278256  ORF Transcript_98396/g.278256 Transcript_98396/m.278256 type:complete len:215 (+) Transcript_98396:786-1430(+)